VTPKRYWARLRADIDRPLRRGAWYHVKKLGPREALVDVLGEAIDVPRPLLDIVSAPPMTVVRRYAWYPPRRSEYADRLGRRPPGSGTGREKRTVLL